MERPNGDDRAGGSAAAGQASVAVAEEGVGAPRRGCGLAEDVGEVAVPASGGGATLRRPGRFLDPGREPGPGAQVRRGGEAGHVQPDLGDDRVSAGGTEAGDLIGSGHDRRERRDQLLDPGLEGGDVGAGLIDAGRHGAQQERVMVAGPPSERFFQ